MTTFHGERSPGGIRFVPRGTPLTETASKTVRRLLSQGLGELELAQAARDDLVGSLTRLSELLARWAARINLTGFRSQEEIARRLILDAVALATALPRFESLADLGSGAGFPGLPIALLRPEARVTLVEARQRPHHFQRAVARQLGLGNVRPLRGRAEQLEPQLHAAVIAQAVAEPRQALVWMLRWAAPGGLLLIPGGERVPRLPPLTGVEPEEPLAYRVPVRGPRRTVWIGRRSLE